MKAISLWPPYGSLIVAGVKKIETRAWRTTYRGPVAIAHTATIGGKPWNRALALEVIRGALGRLDIIPVGCVLGTVEIVDCVQMIGPDQVAHTSGNMPKSNSDEWLFGNYQIGRFMWMLANPVKFDKPIPAKGKQGFWEWNP